MPLVKIEMLAGKTPEYKSIRKLNLRLHNYTTI